MSIVVDNQREEQLGQAIRNGNLARALKLEKKLGRTLRIHDELEPLAAIALLRGDKVSFRSIVEKRAINFFNEDGAKDIIARCFGRNKAGRIFAKYFGKDEAKKLIAKYFARSMAGVG